MDTHRFEGSDTIFVVAGCKEGFIKLAQIIQLNDSYITNRVFTKRVNGPVSALLFYAKPNMFDYYAINYDEQLLTGLDQNKKSADEHLFGDLNADLLDSLCLHVGTCTGYTMTYCSVFDHGFVDANCAYLNDHILYSIDCCDSVLCSTHFLMNGYLYLLFGTYSGKLLCFQMNNVQNKNGQNASNSLIFEAQFDQQVHGIKCINNDKIVVLTLNKINFLNIKMQKHLLHIDHTNIVSV